MIIGGVYEMGTRAIYGLRKNSIDKVTYCHYDGGPDSLGNYLVNFILNTTVENLSYMFEFIDLVDSSSIPTDEQVDECRQFYVKNVFDNDWFKEHKSSLVSALSYLDETANSYFKCFIDCMEDENDIYDWYWLLNRTQGKLDCYLNKSCKYMIDASHGLYDSLQCSWAYIINLDNNTFEIYTGLNKVPQKNRYSDFNSKPKDLTNSNYLNCYLLKSIPLSDLEVNSLCDLY